VHLCASSIGVSSDDPRRFAVSILDTLLGGSTSSRLFQQIRENRGLAYAVYSYGSQYQDTGEFGVYVGTREENLAECCEIIATQFDDLAGGGVRPDELQRAKDNLKGRIVLALESTSSRMSRLGRSIVGDSEIKSVDELIEDIDAVDSEQITAVAGDLLRSDRLAVAAIGARSRPVRAAARRLNAEAELEEVR
jgi:predicted Zn-dependent peptidase